MRRIAAFSVITALLVVAVSCATKTPGVSPGLSDAPTASTTPNPTENTTPTPHPTRDDASETARIIELRADWGLRSDEEWVRQVANDPQAVDSPLGIAVMPNEAAELEAIFDDDPRSRLIAYGSSQPDQFAGAFVDGHGAGPFVMLFTTDLERHRAALEALPGDYPFEVRPARWTELELRSLQMRLLQETRALEGVELVSTNVDTIENVVAVDLKTNDPTLGSSLEAEHPGMLVVTTYPLPGPWQNKAAGDGWRLLAAGQAQSEGYRVRAATSAAEWLTMWDELDPVNPAPDLNIAEEIAVSFGHGIGSSCPETRLDDVVIDYEAQLVFSIASDPLQPRACTADLAGGAFFVVALARAALPDSPFTVSLTQDPVCGGGGDCPFDGEIKMDLR